MNPDSRAAVDRLLRRLDRGARRPRPRFPVAAVYLALGLIVGYQLLVRFVPLVWSSLLPGGMGQAAALPGWAGLVGRLATLCRHRFEPVALLLTVVAVAGFVLGRGPWPLRLLVWLAAVGVVLLDAGIVLVAILTSLQATAQGSGLF